MPNIFNWQRVIYDPHFWAIRYGEFPGILEKDIRVFTDKYDFYNLAILEDDPLIGYVGDEDDPQIANVEVGYRRLSLPFPEHYTWCMDFAAEDGETITGIYHTLFHPDIAPTGLLLAEESGHATLPGLRWEELKQMAACLVCQSFSDFDVRAIVSLLYPLVEYITFDEVEEVRQTLTIAWQHLQVLDAGQAEQWLDQIISVYDKGQVWRLNNQKEWILAFNNPWSKGEDFWVKTEDEGWKTTSPASVRNIKKDSRQFVPFFSVLERFS